MAARTLSIVVEQIVQAPAEQVYQAFTNAGLLRLWLCDVATVSPHRGGRVYLWWNGDFYTSGEYTDIVPFEKVGFTWFGRGDPGPSHVTISMASQGDCTRLTLLHTLPAGKKWEGYADGFKDEWSRSLENLASVLETGKDLRIFNRPMLGILLGEFTIEQAAELGVPTTEGIRLEGTLENMGAHAAGLRKNDVIIGLGGKTITSDFSTLTTALQGKKGGDEVEVVFFRGSEKNIVSMELTRRPVPDIPFDPKELAGRVRKIRTESLEGVEQVFAGATEDQATHKPAVDEWSAKEILAHLLQIERFTVQDISDTLAGQPRWSDSFTENDPAYITALANSYPSYTAMLAELRRLMEELVAYIAAFPPAFLANKGPYFAVAQVLLNDQVHTQSHLDQIDRALHPGRNKK